MLFNVVFNTVTTEHLFNVRLLPKWQSRFIYKLNGYCLGLRVHRWRRHFHTAHTTCARCDDSHHWPLQACQDLLTSCALRERQTSLYNCQIVHSNTWLLAQRELLLWDHNVSFNVNRIWSWRASCYATPNEIFCTRQCSLYIKRGCCILIPNINKYCVVNNNSPLDSIWLSRFGLFYLTSHKNTLTTDCKSRTVKTK
mgnify:CR=1 FL=1